MDREGFAHAVTTALESESRVEIVRDEVAAGLDEARETVYDDDLVSLLQDELSEVPKVYVLDQLTVTAGTGNIVPTATVRLRKDGDVVEGVGTGDGPVDAACKAIDKLTRQVRSRLGESWDAIEAAGL